jgi:EAL domain-containing protein (putative c-di-GMP-specific phosphodiesterase class I)
VTRKDTHRPDAAPDADRFLAEMDREFSGWDDPPARIMRALQRDEFALFAQPVLTLKGEPRFGMAELLVRLREEEAAMLPPGEFFPVFEHYGMMPQLDRWVARHAIARLASGSGVPRFSINVSAQSLVDVAFAADIAAELARARVDPGLIGFEIDESDVLARPESAARFAAAIRKVGCRVLLDSFGHRSVSFAPLKDLQADYVKVDGSIVRALQASEVARTKLKAVVRVGDVVGVGVIAECVEDPEVLALVRDAGAGFAQGFGIRRPAPLDAVADGSA